MLRLDSGADVSFSFEATLHKFKLKFLEVRHSSQFAHANVLEWICFLVSEVFIGKGGCMLNGRSLSAGTHISGCLDLV